MWGAGQGFESVGEGRSQARPEPSPGSYEEPDAARCPVPAGRRPAEPGLLPFHVKHPGEHPPGLALALIWSIGSLFRCGTAPRDGFGAGVRGRPEMAPPPPPGQEGKADAGSGREEAREGALVGTPIDFAAANERRGALLGAHGIPLGVFCGQLETVGLATTTPWYRQTRTKIAGQTVYWSKIGRPSRSRVIVSRETVPVPGRSATASGVPA
jgi:hypothetical protein